VADDEVGGLHVAGDEESVGSQGLSQLFVFEGQPGVGSGERLQALAGTGIENIEYVDELQAA
jgi:hypothetical protein